MVELRRVSGKDAIRALERLGFVKARQQGSHVVMKRCRKAMRDMQFRSIVNLPLERFEEF